MFLFCSRTESLIRCFGCSSESCEEEAPRHCRKGEKIFIVKLLWDGVEIVVEGDENGFTFALNDLSLGLVTYKRKSGYLSSEEINILTFVLIYLRIINMYD